MFAILCFVYGCSKEDDMWKSKGYFIADLGHMLYAYDIGTRVERPILEGDFFNIDGISKVDSDSFIVGLGSYDDGIAGKRIKQYSFSKKELITLCDGRFPTYLPERRVFFFYRRDGDVSDEVYALYWAPLGRPEDAHKVDTNVSKNKGCCVPSWKYLRFLRPVVQVSESEVAFMDRDLSLYIYSLDTGKTAKVKGVKKFLPVFHREQTNELYGRSYDAESSHSKLNLSTMKVTQVQEGFVIRSLYSEKHDTIFYSRSRESLLDNKTYDLMAYSFSDKKHFLVSENITYHYLYGYYQEEAPAGF